MDEIFEKTLLFDFYGELLTENQKRIYELHNLDDLSLGEISEQLEISRQGVFDTLKRCDRQLNNYEEKLQLVQKFVKNTAGINEIHKLALGIVKDHQAEDEAIMAPIHQIEAIAKSILENL